MPASSLKGRVDLYDKPTFATFGLIICLSDFGFPAHQLQAFYKWAQQPGVDSSTSPVEEAVQRIAKQEDFSFEILDAAFNRKIYRAR